MSARATTTATTRPTPRRRGAEEAARRQGGRGREGPRDRRRPEDHGEHDRPGRRHAGVPDLVRLLRPAHAEGGGEVPEGALPALRRPLERRQDPTNVGSYFGYIDEAPVPHRHRRRPCHQDGKLGFVAAKPIPQVLRNINAFTLGARSVNPKVDHQVIFTGDWSMPVKEAEAANSLVDQGVDVITCHVDSPKVVVETAERRGHRLRLPRQPGAAGAQGLPDRRRVELGRSNRLRRDDAGRQAMPHFVRGGLKEGLREDVALRPGGLGRGAQAGRRGQGAR